MPKLQNELRLAVMLLLIGSAYSAGIRSSSPGVISSFMGNRMMKLHRDALNGVASPYHHGGLVPYFNGKKNGTSELQTEAMTQACALGIKTGYWLVGCYVDKAKDPMRMYYDQIIGVHEREAMTPGVCFDFCKQQYGMRFFFIHQDECSCARYYYKSVKGDLGQCDHACAGDPTLRCGGLYKETVYQMHDCVAAMRKPLKPWEGLGLRVEITGKAGLKFFSGSDEIPLVDGLPKPEEKLTDLVATVLDAHNAFPKASQAFNIEGLTADGTDPDVGLTEAKRFNTWVGAQAGLNDVVMVGFESRASYKNVVWGADVEEALRGLGCPAVSKPKDNFGYGAVCSGKSASPQSPIFPYGHVAGYVLKQGTIENDLLYMIDCEIGKGWEDSGECSVTCGGGQQYQTRTVTVEPANGGKPCPEDFSRYIPCNPDPCPIDCQYSEWSGFGECSPACGPGIQFNTRAVVVEPEHGGVECTEDTEKSQSCQIVPCPIDCEFDEWTQWGGCDAFCGFGIQKRRRGRKVFPKWGGLDCEGAFVEEQGCIVRPCPVDCEVGEWGNEGDCSTSCNAGKQKMTRPVLVEAAHGGGECPETEKFVDCFIIPCPVNCEVSDWMETDCSMSCGGGRKKITRELRPSLNLGACVAHERWRKFSTVMCSTALLIVSGLSGVIGADAQPPVVLASASTCATSIKRARMVASHARGPRRNLRNVS
jgi:hypothetical protein